MDISAILIYADNSRTLLRQTLEAHEGIFNREFETLSSFSSIRKLVAHMASAEQRWIRRVTTGDFGDRYEETAPATLPEVFADWDAIRAATHAFAASATASRLADTITISFPKYGVDTRLSVEQALFNIVNHQTYHLGQISMALQRFAIDPPNFDYVLLASHKD